MRVYLAGACSCHYANNEFEKATEWRRIAAGTLWHSRFKVFDPTKYFKENLEFDGRGVPVQNYTYLSQCDLVLVNLDELHMSPGTIFELAWSWTLKKPVVAFGSSRWMEQPHVKDAITVKFDTVDQAVEYINLMYFQ
jgi:nucleoside 2-deoxyribosyltransferase